MLYYPHYNSLDYEITDNMSGYQWEKNLHNKNDFIGCTKVIGGCSSTRLLANQYYTLNDYFNEKRGIKK